MSGGNRELSFKAAGGLFGFIAAVFLFVCMPAFSQNAIWIGEVKEMSLTQVEDGKVQISLVMKEDTTDGKFEPFEPGKIFFVNLSENGTQARVIIDGVSPGKYAEKDLGRSGIISSVKVGTIKGSFSNRDLQLTKSERQIFSTSIMLTSDVALGYHLSRAIQVDSTYTVDLTLFDQSKFGNGEDGMNGQLDTVEITADEFNEPVTMAMNLEGVGNAEWLGRVMKSLENVEDGQFVTLVYPVMHLDPSSAVNLVKHKLSVLGSLIVNQDTSSIIITDVAEYAKAIAQTLAVIDTKTPQVLIEVKIVEVSWDKELEAGIDWNWIDPGGNDNLDILSKTTTPGAEGGLSATMSRLSGDDLQQFITKINAFAQKGRAQLLARPKIIVLNNRSASFHAGSNIPYFRRTGISKNSSASATETDEDESSTTRSSSIGTQAVTYNAELMYLGPFSSDSVSTKDGTSNRDSNTRSTSMNESFGESYVTTGVRLTVTPKIRNSGEIVLDISPSVDEVIGYRTINSAPIIATRSVQSTVRLNNGETIVIGGLFREHEVKSKGGVPILKDIPIAGLLFSKTRSEKQKTEVVFVLTTHLVK